MDKRGTGFLRIREDMEKWELPPPEFEERLGWFVIKFRNPNVERVIETYKFDLNERQKKTIEYIKVHKKITTNDYMKIIVNLLTFYIVSKFTSIVIFLKKVSKITIAI